MELNPTQRDLQQQAQGAEQGAMGQTKKPYVLTTEEAPEIVSICAKAFKEYHINRMRADKIKREADKQKKEPVISLIKDVRDTFKAGTSANPSSRALLDPGFIASDDPEQLVLQGQMKDFDEFQKILIQMKSQLDSDAVCNFSEEQDNIRKNLVLYLNEIISRFKREYHVQSEENIELLYMEKPKESIPQGTWEKIQQFVNMQKFFNEL